jgi:hypothetical protein
MCTFIFPPIRATCSAELSLDDVMKGVAYNSLRILLSDFSHSLFYASCSQIFSVDRLSSFVLNSAVRLESEAKLRTQ